MYAHESVYRQLVEAMAEIASRVRVGPGIEPETQLGPLNNAPQFERVDELVEDAKRANATHFGLMGSVWTQDLDRGAEVAARLEVGPARVNTHAGIDPKVPFGGAKWSGIGYINGRWGLETYTALQVLDVHRR